MFKSVKKWLVVPTQIKPFIKRDGAGENVYDEPVDVLSYPHGKATLIRDVRGNEVTSNLQIFLDGSVDIKLADLVMINGTDHPIKALSPFYDGNTGEVSILVVYL